MRASLTRLSLLAFSLLWRTMVGGLVYYRWRVRILVPLITVNEESFANGSIVDGNLDGCQFRCLRMRLWIGAIAFLFRTISSFSPSWSELRVRIASFCCVFDTFTNNGFALFTISFEPDDVNKSQFRMALELRPTMSAMILQYILSIARHQSFIDVLFNMPRAQTYGCIWPAGISLH